MFPFPYLWQFWLGGGGVRVSAVVRLGAATITARVRFEP